MNALQAKKFIKLGTAIRYLNDVKYKMGASSAPEPLGDNHVVDNIRLVIEITKELKLEGTLKAGAFGKLQRFYKNLQNVSRTETTLTMEQAQELHELARRIRESLLAEGNNRIVYDLDQTEVEAATSPGWPAKLTVGLVLKTPWSIVKWLIGLIIAVFILGVTVSETGWYTRVKEALGDEAPGLENQAPADLSDKK
ncbi:hypothetical protein [Pistricoccus aurantiacus]|uniref:hypothetical protein n=1 Tax=Pistricoccus aurantiacus TaxID=1883414 RepID=UPI003637CAB6